jgi:hypothetical protein
MGENAVALANRPLFNSCLAHSTPDQRLLTAQERNAAVPLPRRYSIAYMADANRSGCGTKASTHLFLAGIEIEEPPQVLISSWFNQKDFNLMIGDTWILPDHMAFVQRYISDTTQCTKPILG